MRSSNFNKNKKGFTLIEILISLAIISIISSATYFSFNQFNNFQNLNATYLDLKTAIVEAKANSSAQVSRKCLGTQTLVGHQIRINNSDPNEPHSYSLEEVCQNVDNSIDEYEIKSTNVLSGITLTTTGNPIRFDVLTGKVTNSGIIKLDNSMQDKSIEVTPDGIIDDVSQ